MRERWASEDRGQGGVWPGGCMAGWAGARAGGLSGWIAKWQGGS
jgi:hypothetical protein